MKNLKCMRLFSTVPGVNILKRQTGETGEFKTNPLDINKNCYISRYNTYSFKNMQLDIKL